MVCFALPECAAVSMTLDFMCFDRCCAGCANKLLRVSHFSRQAQQLRPYASLEFHYECCSTHIVHTVRRLIIECDCQPVVQHVSRTCATVMGINMLLSDCEIVHATGLHIVGGHSQATVIASKAAKNSTDSLAQRLSLMLQSQYGACAATLHGGAATTTRCHAKFTCTKFDVALLE